MRYILVAVGVALLVGATTALGGSTRIAQNQVRLGITNGVIHACVETDGGGATIGDIKLNHCHKGFKQISWNVRGPKGARGDEDGERDHRPPAGVVTELAVEPGQAVGNGQVVCVVVDAS